MSGKPFDARQEMRGGIAINPGSGPVRGATADQAAANMEALVADVQAQHGIRYAVARAADADYGDGRFAFDLIAEGERHQVQMPGLALEHVRYTGADDQDIWDFPRLYVDDGSWVWKFAINACKNDEESRA